jgi:RNA polymerase sigma factor (sigma-70 family)
LFPIQVNSKGLGRGTYLILENQAILNLLNGCLRNDRASQKGLYLLLHKYAFAIAYRYLDNRDQIEDLLNRSFIELFKHIQQFDPEKFPDPCLGLRARLQRVIVIHCIDFYLEMNLSVEAFTIQDGMKPMEIPNGSAPARPPAEDIIEVIRGLPSSLRIVFNLFVIEGMSHQEISNHLNISRSWSRFLLLKARESVRKNLDFNERTPLQWNGSPQGFSAQDKQPPLRQSHF